VWLAVQDVGAHIQLRGYVQMMTARKPCGDEADDDIGHGTHLVGVATGDAVTPDSQASKRSAAAAHNGVVPKAKLYFHDIMQNGDVACKFAGDTGGICERVDVVTPPLNLYDDLLAKAHRLGVRVHLNAWGCKVPRGELGDYCNDYSAQAADMDRFMFDNPESLIVTAVGDAGELARVGTVAAPATNKNGIAVGGADTWNEAYVSGCLTRDPARDICDCTFPNECSKSERILGVTVDDAVPGATRAELMARLSPCCNDEVQVEHVLKDQMIPAKQMWSYVFPEMNMFDPDISTYVKDTFGWPDDGAALEYDYTAKSEVFSTPSYTVADAFIQVMVFPRQDFYEYFEGGNQWCSPQHLELGLTCRPNPCITSEKAQEDGSEVCLSRPTTIINAEYEKQACTAQRFDGKIYQDLHCHTADCLEDPKPGDNKWGEKPQHGCDMSVEEPNCCNDAFLHEFCLNKPCNRVSSRQRGVAKHNVFPFPNTLKKAVSGYAVVIRNMASQPVSVSGTFRIRKLDYPCTLEQCCMAEPAAACCPRNYTRLYNRLPKCAQCPRGNNDPNCRPYESSEVPSWTARGPAKVKSSRGELATDASGWIKPDVLAPSAAVAANSDGNRNTAGDGNEFGVQCGLSSNASTSMFGCDVLKSDVYDASAATIQKAGSSVAAAFIAGAAIIIRQYLADGYYPSGVRLPSRDNLPSSVISSRGTAPSDNPWARPPAALVKAMIIHSAQSVGGRTNVNTYFPDPACDPQELDDDETCPLVYSTSRDDLGVTPNMFEGFGRPQLDSVLWFADSKWSLLLIQNRVFNKGGLMHTYGFRLLDNTGVSNMPFKVTMCYTDPPSAPGASEVLVNDLDLIVQRTTQVMVLNASIGKKVETDVFERGYGNARGAATKDGFNTCEHFAIPEHSQSVITVIIVAFRLAQSPQAYSLVVTGMLRPKYHAWITAAEGRVRVVRGLWVGFIRNSRWVSGVGLEVGIIVASGKLSARFRFQSVGSNL